MKTDKTLDKAIIDRRSYYSIGKEMVISEKDVKDIVETAVKHTPSAFNSQSSRIAILFGKQHDKLWDITKDLLRPLVPADKFSATESKLSGFRDGCGTILFFEDQSVVSGLQESFPLYKDNFPIWSLESAGMLQLNIWMMLETAGFGANLQHYNPIVDEKVHETWNISAQWKLLAEMPFGKPLADPDAKTFLPVKDRIMTFGDARS